MLGINDLERCIQRYQLNHSQAREVIFRVLLETESCLNVPEILESTKERYPKNISANTVYRHLNFFVACGLAIALQNESKKTYYCLVDQNSKVFTMCPKCGLIQKANKNGEALSVLDKEYRQAEYITIHKKCERCV
ncbi:MAG: transcriptional repressor [Sulfurovum sp.]|nr:transcriptional repressor [Sulfurovum sp.]MDD3499712.1 transcriptional repressor [Sulfurovum sp.]